MKKIDKKMISIVLLSTALISVLSFSFAWFINNSDVSIGSENEFAIETGFSLSISRYLGMVQNPNNPDDPNDLVESWSPYGVKSSFTSPTLKDITGDGYNFATPYSLVTRFDDDEHAIGRDEPVFPMFEISETDHDRYYIEETLKFKTNMACSIYLSDSSYVLPLNAANDTTYDTTNESIKITGLSSNNIAGAARVAFLENTNPVPEQQSSSGSSTGGLHGSPSGGQKDSSIDPNEVLADDILNLKQIWIPNPNFQLKFDSTTLEATNFTLTGVREDSYGYLTNNPDQEHRNEAVVHTYTPEDYVQKKVVVGNDAFYNSYSGFVRQSAPLLDFTNDTGEYYEKKLTIRIWIEGTDREANEALNMGKFRMNIRFAGISKQAPDPNDETFLQGITLDRNNRKLMNGDQPITSTDNVIYTVNGIDWYEYTSSIPLQYSTPSNGVMVNKDINDFYIKLEETETLERSSYKYLTFTPDPESEPEGGES